MTNIGDFCNRTVLIDGADTPLGSATAHYLAVRGARVALLGDDPDLLDATAGAVVTGSVSYARALGGHDDIYALVSESIAQAGGVDAGFSARGSMVRTLDDEESSSIRGVVDGDLTQTLIWTKALVEYFSVKHTGRIVTTAVSAGLYGLARAATFSAVSGAIGGMTKSYALRLRGTNIRINAVAPILNPESGGIIVDESTVFDVEQYTPGVVAPLVGFLTSDHCQISGTIISAGAGRIARTFSGTAAGFFDAEADHLDIEKALAQIMSIEDPVTLDDSRDELLLIEV